MVHTLLLIHSPLLGPSSWRPIADAARVAGLLAVVPDLGGAFARTADWWSTVASVSADASPTGGEVTVVGHSGAGHYLPCIGGAIGLDRASFVFVDAVLPPSAGTVRPAAAIGRLLDDHVDEGWLEPWLDWWAEDVIESILPNPWDRDALRRDVPTVRRAVYDEAVPVPDGWQERPIRYVQTSPAYATEAEQARSHGWGHAVIDGTHLSIMTDPRGVLGHIVG